MNILVKFPTRGRKEKFFSVLERYIDFLNSPENIRFLITIDDDDPTMNTEDVFNVLRDLNVDYTVGHSGTKINANNRDLNGYDYEWDIILLASDDMIPQIRGYDDIIRNKMCELYPDTDGVLWFNDGFQNDKLNTLSILGRKYYDRFKYLYYPEYKSVWADNEFMEVSKLLNKQTYIDLVIIKHEHPDWGYNSQDHIHTANHQNESYDRNLFNSRKLNNFFIK